MVLLFGLFVKLSVKNYKNRFGGDEFMLKLMGSISKMQTMKSIDERILKKVLLSFLVTFLALSCFGTNYFISPNGNDNNKGIISSPWATLNKVWTVLKAGDTVYLRGGTYAFNTQQRLTGKNGASGSLINIWAYPNENPVLTKSGSYTTNEGIHFSGNYFY